MWFFIIPLFLWTPPVYPYSLIKGEKIEGMAIWAEKGQFLLDRGAEDGVSIGEYVQVIQNGRYKSRAVSLMANLEYSLWASYNIYEPLALNKNIVLKASTRHPFSDETRSEINLEVPSRREFAIFLDSFKQEVARTETTEHDIKVEKRLKSKFEERKQSDQSKYSYLQNNDANIKGIALNVNVAPVSFKNISGAFDMAYKVSLKQHVPTRHKIDGSFSYTRSSFVSSLSATAISKSRYDFSLFYEYDKFNKYIRPFSFMTFERQREDLYYPIRMAFNVGPIGIKYLYSEAIAFSYIPVIDYFSGNGLVDNTHSLYWEAIEVSDVNFRHCFIFQGHWPFQEGKVELFHTAFFRPIQNIDGLDLDFSDVNLKMETEIKYNIHQYLSASYVNLILNDQRIQKHEDIPQTEVTHMVTMNYEKRF